MYAKLFYADIDARGPMRMNRPVMLMPPAANDIRQQGERTEKTLRHLLSGKTALLQSVTPSPTLDALVAGFAHRLVEHPDQDFGTTARSAILALAGVQPAPGEAPKPVAVAADGSVAETEHSIMAKSTGAPASHAPVPDKPRTAATPDVASPISAVEAEFGASPAEADTRMSQTVAMHEAATDSTEAELAMPTMDPGQMCKLLAGVSGRLNALGRPPAPALQAAE